MSINRFQVLKDSQETITCTFDSRPDTCIVQTYDVNGNLMTSGIATVGEQYTVSGVCGVSQSDRYKLKLNPTISGLKIDHSYLLRNSSYQSEKVVIRSKPPTPSLVDVMDPLCFDYDSGDSLEDTTVYRNLFVDETDTLGVDYRANFYAIMPDESIQSKDILFDIVTSKFDQPITGFNLHKYDPLMKDNLPSNLSSWDDLLTVAWDAVYSDLLTTGIRPELIMDPARLALLHLYKFKMMVGEIGVRVGDMFAYQAAPYYKAKYTDLFNSLTNKLGWVDTNQNKIPDELRDPVRRRFTI
jgi:hypothetical protein